MFNPLYLLGPPILIFLSLPLIALATVTTTLAFVTLFFRVSIVYFELALALFHTWLFNDTSFHNPPKPRVAASSGYSSPAKYHRSRRSSAASLALSQDLTAPRQPPTKSESFASLFTTAGPNRDFEGVGGWRMPGDGQEEALWIGINSRLELPAVKPERQRKHHRSLTGGSQKFSWSPDAIRMSPVQSRARTPNANEGSCSPDEYFTLQSYKRIGCSVETLGSSHIDERRKSSGASSTCSTSSSSRTPRTTARNALHV
ncbi:hypothetical protein HDK77DRAFT_55312 [Phyllosticta capitalensis]|uniref:uncharacterized protein n=1 Tax=Phyllosticta capitalensis TaxID=121624 RepID=UPI00312DB277